MNDEAIKRRIQQHLDEIESYIKQPHSQKAEVLQNIEAHIHDELEKKSGGNPTIEDLEAVIAEMDPPDSYGEGTDAKQPSSVVKIVVISIAVILLAIIGFCITSFLKIEKLPSCSKNLARIVPFETGDAKFQQGDSLAVDEIKGMKEKIEVGETYRVKGKYTLKSRDKAKLLLSITSTREHEKTKIYPDQFAIVERGAGEFSLVIRFDVEGYLHLSLYPVEGGSSFGDVYFGQGDGVLRARKSGNQDTIVFTQHMGNVITAKMEFQTQRKGERYDIRFDDLKVRGNDSSEELRHKEAEAKTGGLILRYTFDDATNTTTVADSSGQDACGLAHGYPQFAAGVSGKAMVFDGQDDYVEVPITSRLRDVQNSNYTIMAWVYPEAKPSSDKYFYGVVTKPGCDYGIVYDSGQKFYFTHFFVSKSANERKTFSLDDVAGIFMGQGPSQPCQWHHVAVVGCLDEKRFTIFTNGVLAATEVQKRFERSLENNRPWYIGVADPNVWRCPAQGMMDDVRIYNRALSEEEIKLIVKEK